MRICKLFAKLYRAMKSHPLVHPQKSVNFSTTPPPPPHNPVCTTEFQCNYLPLPQLHEFFRFFLKFLLLTNIKCLKF